MRSMQTTTNQMAIGLSLFCTIHCLTWPLAAALLPSMTALPLGDEAFHLWMLIAVLPTSVYALTMGCKKHKSYGILLTGGVGLCLLSATVFLGHEQLGEMWEKLLTVAGASIIALGHFWNYRLCQQQDSCQCPENKGATTG